MLQYMFFVGWRIMVICLLDGLQALVHLLSYNVPLKLYIYF